MERRYAEGKAKGDRNGPRVRKVSGNYAAKIHAFSRVVTPRSAERSDEGHKSEFRANTGREPGLSRCSKGKELPL